MRSIVFLLALALVAGAAAATPLRVTVVARSGAAEVGTTWRVTILARQAGRPANGLKLTVRLAQGSRVMTYPADALGKGRYRADISFPAPGRWTLAARAGGRNVSLGAVTVAPEPLRIREPFYLAVDRDGTLLVCDGNARRVLRLDPRNGRVTEFAPRADNAIAVATDATGAVVVVQHEADRVLRVDGGTLTAISAKLGGPTAVAIAPDGSVVVAEYAGRVQRIRPDGSMSLVAGRGADASDGDGGDPARAGIDRPHGIAVAPDGTVYVSDTYGGKVRKIANGRISTVASGLETPIGLAVDRDGSVLVGEMRGNRVLRVAPDGRTTTLTDSVTSPNAVAVAPDGTIYVSDVDGGAVYRVARDTGRPTRVTR